MKRSSIRWLWTIALILALPQAARPCRADPNPWAAGKQWLTLRAGYAKSSVEFAAPGGAGYGFGYSRMLSKVKIYKWTLFKDFSLGGYVHHEVLGRFGGAAEIEVPATLELTRHVNWNTALRPYVGVGAGPFYRKLYRTGQDLRNVSTGYYLSFGANTPISGQHLLGVDFRFIRVDDTNSPPNPVFGVGSGRLEPGGGVEQRKGTHWSVKLAYTLVQ
jgi:hypothetical protein